MRIIGTEMMTFGAGLPVLYFATADVFLGGLHPGAVMFVALLSFLLIALGHEVRGSGAGPNKKSADAARLVGSNASRDAIDHDTYPSNVGSAKRLEPRHTPVDPTRRIA